MIEIIDTFLGVLEKKENNYFKNFLSALPVDSSWYLLSDYCVGDSEKLNDVLTFSVLCNYDKHQNIKDLIKNLAPKDLKKTRTINSDFIEYLNSPFVYHFSVVIPKKEKLLSKMFNDFPLEQMLNWMDQVYANSIEAGIPHKDFYIEARKRIKMIQIETQRKTFNKKLIRQILLTSALGTCIIYLLQKLSSPQKIAWISDRDAIIDKYDGFAFDNIYFWYEIAVENKEFEKTNTKILFISPEKVGQNNFDELIRIPDYIAGSLASYDLENRINFDELKDKYTHLFTDIFTEPKNQATLRLESNDGGLSVYNFKWFNKNST